MYEYPNSLVGGCRRGGASPLLGGVGCGWSTVGLGAGGLVGASLSHPTVWALAPFVAAVVYLVLESLTTALAERIVAARGEDDADDVSP